MWLHNEIGACDEASNHLPMSTTAPDNCALLNAPALSFQGQDVIPALLPDHPPDSSCALSRGPILSLESAASPSLARFMLFAEQTSLAFTSDFLRILLIVDHQTQAHKTTITIGI